MKTHPQVKSVSTGNVRFGHEASFVLIAGPCVIENRKITLSIATVLKDLTARMNIPFIFKASYDKANRSSMHSFRGPGLIEGLAILLEIKNKLGIPILSDVHSVDEAESVSDVLDVIQIPAFLCRQTDILLAAGRTGKIVNVKKGQFLAPWDMKNMIEKIESTGNKRILLTERGSTFGYNNLVSDFRALPILRGFGYPVIFDATHSVQQPGGRGTSSGGQSEFIPTLARCAAAAGCDGIFLEVHTHPEKALSDGPNMLALHQLEDLLKDLKAIDEVVKRRGKNKE